MSQVTDPVLLDSTGQDIVTHISAVVSAIQSRGMPSPSASNPAMDGTAFPGTSNDYARGDHVHPTDTSRQAAITASGILKGDGAGGVSAATAGTDYQAPLTAGTDYATPAQLANKEDKYFQPGDTIDFSAYPYLTGITVGSGSTRRLVVWMYTPKTNGLNLNISHNLTVAWIRGDANQYNGSIPQNGVSVSGSFLVIPIYSTTLPHETMLVAAIGGTITFS